ncbi:unnamed protein product, partial [Musa textilis]
TASKGAFRIGVAIAIPRSIGNVTIVSARTGRVGLAHGCRDVHLGEGRHKAYGCDHTSTKAPDPIRTPKLSVLGRE